jgi:hypothetical protein
MAKASASVQGRRPDPAGFLQPRPDAATAPDDPLRAVKAAAVPRSEQLGAAELGAARGFVRGPGSGRAARVAGDTTIGQAAAKVAAIRADANLSAAGQQAALGKLGAGLKQEAERVLGAIARGQEREAPGPGPGAVRLKADPVLDSLLAYGTAAQVVAALDNASGDAALNDLLWAAQALIDGRLHGSPRRLDIVAAMQRAQARMQVLEEWLARQLLADRLAAAEHVVRLAASELFRNGYVDPAYAATGTFRALDEPVGDLAAYFDAVHDAALNPGGAPWVLQPDGSLVGGGESGGEARGPLRSMADERGPAL